MSSSSDWFSRRPVENWRPESLKFMEEKRKRRLSKFLEVRLVSSYLYSKRAWKVLFCSQTFWDGIVDDYYFFFFLSFFLHPFHELWRAATLKQRVSILKEVAKTMKNYARLLKKCVNMYDSRAGVIKFDSTFLLRWKEGCEFSFIMAFAEKKSFVLNIVFEFNYSMKLI